MKQHLKSLATEALSLSKKPSPESVNELKAVVGSVFKASHDKTAHTSASMDNKDAAWSERAHMARHGDSSAATQLYDILNKDARTLTFVLEFDHQDDVDFYKNCWPDIITPAICAISDHAASSLSILADVCATLSCEALKIEYSKFSNPSDINATSKDRI
nr:hypothetical protein [Tanacetum cinerariifolium]